MVDRRAGVSRYAEGIVVLGLGESVACSLPDFDAAGKHRSGRGSDRLATDSVRDPMIY